MNGLFLLDLPTGFGKTHSVLDFILYAACNDEYKDRKLFFITTLKKNLPIDELRKRFESIGKIDLFKDKFLFIDSNADAVVENLTQDLIKTIPADILRTNEFKIIRQDVEFIQRQNKNEYNELKGFPRLWKV